MRCVSTRTRGKRETPCKRPGPCTSARTRVVRHFLCIGRRRLAVRDPSLKGGRREAQGDRVHRSDAHEMETRRVRACAEHQEVLRVDRPAHGICARCKPRRQLERSSALVHEHE
jgi:hypothetical protein